MKNPIYVSILAVLFLCSCQGKSFLDQRYTHFDNKASKSSPKQVLVHTHKEIVVPCAIALCTEPSTEQQSLYTSYVFNTYTKPAEEKAAEAESRKQHELTADNASRNTQAFHHVKGGWSVKVVKSQAERLIKAGQEQQAKAAQRGIIFGLINLAFFIVLCVIVAAGVIFLVTLLAV